MTLITASVPATTLNATSSSWRRRIHVMPDGYRAIVSTDGTNLLVKTAATGGTWSAFTTIRAGTALNALIDTVVVGSNLYCFVAGPTSVSCTILPYTTAGAWGAPVTSTPLTALPFATGSIRAVYDALGATGDSQHTAGTTGLIHLLLDAGADWYVYALDPNTSATVPKVVVTTHVSTGVTTPSFATNMILRSTNKLYALTSTGSTGWRGFEIEYVASSTSSGTSGPSTTQTLTPGGSFSGACFLKVGTSGGAEFGGAGPDIYSGLQKTGAFVAPFFKTDLLATGWGNSFAEYSGVSVPAGTWSFTLVISLTQLQGSCSARARFYERTTNGTYTLLGIVSTGTVSYTTASTTVTATGSAALAAHTFASGSVLYVEWDILTAAGAGGTGLPGPLNNSIFMLFQDGLGSQFSTPDGTGVTVTASGYVYSVGAAETPGLPASVFGAALSVAGAETVDNPVDCFVTATNLIGYLQRNPDGSYTTLQNLAASGVSITDAPSAASDLNGSTSVFAQGTFGGVLHIGVMKKTGGLWGSYLQEDTSAGVQAQSFAAVTPKGLGLIGGAIAYVDGAGPFNLEYEDAAFIGGATAPSVTGLILVPSVNDVFGVVAPFTTTSLTPHFRFIYNEGLSTSNLAALRVIVARTDIVSTVWDTGRVVPTQQSGPTVVAPGASFDVIYGSLGAAATALVPGGSYTVTVQVWETTGGSSSTVSPTTAFNVVSAPLVTPTTPLITQVNQSISFRYAQAQGRPAQGYQVQLLDTTGAVKFDSGTVTQSIALAAYATTLLAQTPLIYWRLGETTGTAAADSASGGTHTGLYVNAVIGQSGSVTGDGDSNILSSGTGKQMTYTAATGVPTGASARSVSCWFKTTAPSSQALVAWGTQNTNNQMFSIETVAGGTGIFIWASGTGQDQTYSTAPYGDGNWHHLVVTNDGTTTAVYLDGALQGSQSHTFATLLTTDGVSVASLPNGDLPLTGSIDEVAIWTRALSAAEVATQYQAQSAYGVAVRASTPLLWWRLDEASSATVVSDSSGNGRTGTYGTRTAHVAGATTDGDFAITANGSVAAATASGTGLPAGNSARSAEIWFKTTSTGTLWSYGTYTTNNLFELRVTSATTIQFFGFSNSAIWTAHAGSFNDGAWHHALLTYNGASVELWFDGNSLGALALSASLNTLVPGFGVKLGISGDAITAPLSGSLDEFALYDHVLSATEILAHYTQYPSAVITTAPLNLAGIANLANYLEQITVYVAPSTGAAWSGVGSLNTFVSIPTPPAPSNLTAAPMSGGSPLDGGYDLLSWDQGTDNFVANGDLEAGAGLVSYYQDPFTNGSGWDTTSGASYGSNIVTLAASTGILTSQAYFYNNQTLAVRFFNNASATTKLDLRFMLPSSAVTGYSLRINATTPSIQFQKLNAGVATAIGSNLATAMTASTWYWAVVTFSTGTTLSATIYNDAAGVRGTVFGSIASFTDGTNTASGGISLANLGSASQQIGGTADGSGLRLTGPGPASWSTGLSPASPVWGAWYLDPVEGSMVLSGRQASADAGANFTWITPIAPLGTGSSQVTLSARVSSPTLVPITAQVWFYDQLGGFISLTALTLPTTALYAVASGTCLVPVGAVSAQLRLVLPSGALGQCKIDNVQLEGGAVVTPFHLQNNAVLSVNNIYQRTTGDMLWTLIASVAGTVGLSTLRSYWVPNAIPQDFMVTAATAQAIESPGTVVTGITMTNRIGLWLNDPLNPTNCVELGVKNVGDAFSQLEPIEDKDQAQLFGRSDVVVTVGTMYSYHLPEIVYQLEDGYESGCFALLQAWDRAGTTLQLRIYDQVLQAVIVASKPGAQNMAIIRSTAIEFQAVVPGVVLAPTAQVSTDTDLAANPVVAVTVLTIGLPLQFPVRLGGG